MPLSYEIFILPSGRKGNVGEIRLLIRPYIEGAEAFSEQLADFPDHVATICRDLKVRLSLGANADPLVVKFSRDLDAGQSKYWKSFYDFAHRTVKTPSKTRGFSYFVDDPKTQTELVRLHRERAAEALERKPASKQDQLVASATIVLPSVHRDSARSASERFDQARFVAERLKASQSSPGDDSRDDTSFDQVFGLISRNELLLERLGLLRRAEVTLPSGTGACRLEAVLPNMPSPMPALVIQRVAAYLRENEGFGGFSLYPDNTDAVLQGGFFRLDSYIAAQGDALHDAIAVASATPNESRAAAIDKLSASQPTMSGGIHLYRNATAAAINLPAFLNESDTTALQGQNNNTGGAHLQADLQTLIQGIVMDARVVGGGPRTGWRSLCVAICDLDTEFSSKELPGGVHLLNPLVVSGNDQRYWVELSKSIEQVESRMEFAGVVTACWTYREGETERVAFTLRDVVGERLYVRDRNKFRVQLGFEKTNGGPSQMGNNYTLFNSLPVLETVLLPGNRVAIEVADDSFKVHLLDQGVVGVVKNGPKDTWWVEAVLPWTGEEQKTRRVSLRVTPDQVNELKADTVCLITGVWQIAGDVVPLRPRSGYIRWPLPDADSPVSIRTHDLGTVTLKLTADCLIYPRKLAPDQFKDTTSEIEVELDYNADGLVTRLKAMAIPLAGTARIVSKTEGRVDFTLKLTDTDRVVAIIARPEVTGIWMAGADQTFVSVAEFAAWLGDSGEAPVRVEGHWGSNGEFEAETLEPFTWDSLGFFDAVDTRSIAGETIMAYRFRPVSTVRTGAPLDGEIWVRYNPSTRILMPHAPSYGWPLGSIVGVALTARNGGIYNASSVWRWPVGFGGRVASVRHDAQRQIAQIEVEPGKIFDLEMPLDVPCPPDSLIRRGEADLSFERWEAVKACRMKRIQLEFPVTFRGEYSSTRIVVYDFEGKPVVFTFPDAEITAMVTEFAATGLRLCTALIEYDASQAQSVNLLGLFDRGAAQITGRISIFENGASIEPVPLLPIARTIWGALKKSVDLAKKPDDSIKTGTAVQVDRGALVLSALTIEAWSAVDLAAKTGRLMEVVEGTSGHDRFLVPTPRKDLFLTEFEAMQSMDSAAPHNTGAVVVRQTFVAAVSLADKATLARSSPEESVYIVQEPGGRQSGFQAASIQKSDGSFIKVSPALQILGTAALMQWSGWSLVAPRPTTKKGKDRIESVESNPFYRLRPTGSDLPLRFGTEYEFRARVMDIGCCIPPTAEEAPPNALPPKSVIFRRYEPVPPPLLQRGRGPGKDEPLDFSWLVVSQKIARLELEMAPPVARFDLVDLCGMFDPTWSGLLDLSQPEAREKAARTQEQLTRVTTYVKRHEFRSKLTTEEQVERENTSGHGFVLNYADERSQYAHMPDPYAHGIQVELKLGARHPASDSAGLKPAVLQFRERLTSFLDSGRSDEDWPNGRILKLVIVASESEEPEIRVDHWTNRIVVGLPPGAEGDLELSCIPPKDFDRTHFAQVADGRSIFTRKIIHVVHATELVTPPPLIATHQVYPDLTYPGTTKMAVAATLSYEPRLTGRVSLQARRIVFEDRADMLLPNVPLSFVLADKKFDPVDEMAGASVDWSVLNLKAQASSPQDAVPEAENATVEARKLSEYVRWIRQARQKERDYITIGENPEALTRDFIPSPALSVCGLIMDTRGGQYRRYRIRAAGRSRFEADFPNPPAGTREFASDRSIWHSSPRDEDEVEIEILANRAPLAPEPAYVVPLFDWHRQEVPGKGTATVHRSGGFRIYLQRGWFSSGEGERLGVVFSTSDEGLTTRWGYDPLAPPRQKLPPLVANELEKLNGIKAIHVPHTDCVVIPFEVSYSTDRALWYADVAIPDGPAYAPFVQFALCRYQAKAEVPYQISPIAQLDYFQLAPDRTVSVERAESSNRFTVTFRGPLPKGGLEHRVSYQPLERLNVGDDPVYWRLERNFLRNLSAQPWEPMTADPKTGGFKHTVEVSSNYDQFRTSRSNMRPFIYLLIQETESLPSIDGRNHERIVFSTRIPLHLRTP